MKKTIELEDFQKEMKVSGFSEEGLRVLFHYLTNVEMDYDEEMELVIDDLYLEWDEGLIDDVLLGYQITTEELYERTIVLDEIGSDKVMFKIF